jgi:hypothetical protein
VLKKQEVISKQLEEVGADMDRMQELLDELDKLNNAVIDLDIRCACQGGPGARRRGEGPASSALFNMTGVLGVQSLPRATWCCWMC